MYVYVVMYKLCVANNPWQYLCDILEIPNYVNFCSCDVVENEACFVLKCLLCDAIKYRLYSLSRNVILDNLNFFFHLKHQVRIILYLTD